MLPWQHLVNWQSLSVDLRSILCVCTQPQHVYEWMTTKPTLWPNSDTSDLHLAGVVRGFLWGWARPRGYRGWWHLWKNLQRSNRKSTTYYESNYHENRIIKVGTVKRVTRLYAIILLITNYFWTARESCQPSRSAQPVLCEDHHPALTVRNFKYLVLVATPQSFECLLFPLISTNSCVFHPALDLLSNRPGPFSPSLNAVSPWLTYYVVPIPSACIVSYYYIGVWLPFLYSSGGSLL